MRRTAAARLEPIDKKMLGKELAIPAGAIAGAQDGDLVAVETGRAPRLGRPTARVVERLGSLASERAVSLIAIHAHSIPSMFSRDTLAEAEAAKPATLSGREDWRELPLITIDPPDAKDHDDAVHAEPDTAGNNHGGFIVTVAIADVAHYVTPGSALDREALVRGNSVYFPDRVVPMLPERISNDLCSLRPREDRAALAVRMVIGADGRKRSHTFHRIMMRSAAKLSYQQTQAAIDGRPDDTTGPLLALVLKPLYGAYEALKRARAERQPLDLDLPERKILLKPDGTVDRVITPGRQDANKLIEEFMILANVAAAETLEKARVPLVYRVHDEPGIEKVNALREFLATLDIPFAKGGAMRAEAFNKILARVKGHDAEQLINDVVLRTQAQAEYAAENYGHFGLNLRRYAHFTSPIRRYADLIVHRGLIRALKLGNDGLPEATDNTALAEIAAQISAAERRAMLAERETNDRLIAHFLVDRIGASFRRPHFRRAPRRPVRETAAKPAPTASFRPAPSAMNISAMTKQVTPWSVRDRAKPTGSATASPSNWWKRRPLPGRCALSFCPRGVLENRPTVRETNRAASTTAHAANNGRHDDRPRKNRFGSTHDRTHDQIGARPNLA